MPKNKGKGGKNRRRGKNENESEKRELVFKEDGQEYAQVIKMLGNGRLEAMCFDGVKRLCHIRGKLRKKVWINTSDIILVGLRDYQDQKADVILKYNADEARSLKAYGELPEHAKINETDTFGPGDDEDIQFDDIGDDDEDIDDGKVDISLQALPPCQPLPASSSQLRQLIHLLLKLLKAWNLSLRTSANPLQFTHFIFCYNCNVYAYLYFILSYVEYRQKNTSIYNKNLNHFMFCLDIWFNKVFLFFIMNKVHIFYECILVYALFLLIKRNNIFA
uniref:Eukaryotic translation initiation factor 4C n=2 Tax=Protacanthopterygii TaxID=41705 RepID=A0A6Q2YDD0_ESOLU